MKHRITLFLMTYKGYKVLETLGKNYRELIDFVITQRDKNVQDDYYSEIQTLCKYFNIPCYNRQENYVVNSQYALAISWRWLIDLKEAKLIVFHDSLLPKYRGFNPLVSYLINKEEQIGVTALFANNEYDKGEIIGQSISKISYPIKISEAILTVSNNYVDLAQQIAGKINRNIEITGEEQDETQATYSLWRDEDDYRINWEASASHIRRFVDAIGHPYKGASSYLKDRLVRVIEVEDMADVVIENRTPGKIIFLKDSFPIVVCGQGLVKIKNLIDDETGESLLPLKNIRLKFR